MSLDSYGISSPKMLNSANETIILLEEVTNAFKLIDTDHGSIHEGKFYENSVQTTLTAGGTYDIAFTTPADLYMHYRPAKIVCSADKLTIGFYEDCSVVGGATLTAYNHRRATTAAATMIFVTSASITAIGTSIHKSYIGGGTGVGGSRVGAETGQKNEWVLKQTTNYCLRLSNASSSSNIVNINNIWYEETNG